ncbi:MAG: hypothetical protein ABJH98_07935 [Reichenbachiella sp.]|uniref:hypothetical protein n=1 Tax=Reichenbachiella sp. TaxID=2184521 RepID=UPI00329725D0
MNKQTRIDKIQEFKDNHDSMGQIEIPWDDELKSEKVYRIPLEFLIYNKYNGRILSRTKSYERQQQQIDAETKEGKQLLEKLLWDSKPKKNEETLGSLEKYGQEKVGIITKDGIIIDGNRRAMLLNRITKYDYFKAVILPIEFDGDPIAIEKFETKYQLGEERKLDYNPTEIYLKIQRLYFQLSGQSRYPNDIDRKNGIKVDKAAIKKIYEWVGNYKTIGSERDIEYTLEVMNVMEEYLDFMEYNGIYTALDDKEEQFRDLASWLKSFYGESSAKPFDGYSDSDVDDLKSSAFDLIRIRLKNEKFRYLGRGQRPNHFFGNKDLWESFFNSHLDIVGGYVENKIDLNTKDIEKHLNGRDNDLKEGIGQGLVDNVDLHYQRLRNRQSQDEPVKLLNKAIDSIDSINVNSKNFGNPEAQDLLNKLGEKVEANQIHKSPSRLFDRMVKILESIDVNSLPENEMESVRISTKKIQQICYQIHKHL